MLLFGLLSALWISRLSPCRRLCSDSVVRPSVCPSVRLSVCCIEQVKDKSWQQQQQQQWQMEPVPKQHCCFYFYFDGVQKWNNRKDELNKLKNLFFIYLSLSTTTPWTPKSRPTSGTMSRGTSCPTPSNRLIQLVWHFRLRRGSCL